MNLPVAWLIIGVLEGWAISRALPGEHPLAPATVWGIVGAAVGASISSVILVVYRLRRRRP